MHPACKDATIQLTKRKRPGCTGTCGGLGGYGGESNSLSKRLKRNLYSILYWEFDPTRTPRTMD